MTSRHDALQPERRASKHRNVRRGAVKLASPRFGASSRSARSARSARHRAGATAFGFRPSASLHRSAPRGPSRRRRLTLGALAGGTVVAASSGLAAILASGAYAAPQADLHPTTTAAAYLMESDVHEQQQVSATTAELAAERRRATDRRASAEAAEQSARHAAASRAEQRAALMAAPSFRGLASWYGPGFEGHRTASGTIYDENALTAASRTLPLGTHLQVCHDGSCVTVLINDRGPAPTSRVLDLSRAAAIDIGVYSEGVGEVTATVVG
jgi:rare lipoprotein A (peptidoglycan hydrolase)